MSGYSLLYRRFSRAAALFLLLTAYAPAADGGSRHAPVLRQGLTALAKGKHDSAIVCFVRSFSEEGLSRDSLFYFWSEALLRKGILDSALAANYMVSGDSGGTFRVKTLLQRSAIYRRLGWDDEAERLLDTVRASREYRRALFMPDIDLGIAVGYGAEQRSADTAGPWGAGAGGSLDRIERGPFGRADIRTAWKLTHGQRYWAAGLAGSIAHRQYHPDGSLHAADSTDITGSVFSSAVGKSSSVMYTLSVNRRRDDSLFFGNSIEGGVVGSGRRLPMLWGGGSVFLTTSGRFGNARVWLFASALQTLGKRLQANYQLFANAYFEQPTSFGFTVDSLKKLYADDGRRLYPVFYIDGSYSTMIDTSRLHVVTGALRDDLDDMIASAGDTAMYVGLKQPLSGLLINPRFSLTLKSRLPVRLGISWKLNWFPEPYEWDQVNIFAKYLIYSRSDEAYYIVPVDPLMRELTPTYTADGLAIAPAARPVIHHSMHRIDNTVAADLSVELYDGRFGTAAFKTYAAKTWSTLLKKAPIEIPEWSVSVSLEWRLKIADRLVQR
ncbi:MAG: hypothetical protein JW913_09635 [Chitinispirillaceae bacterium]|nr:hypothetical protein [Chitinispirillaceae bacterium]